mmetsp:Transcript_8114/g.18538  ORF Transcript_8114/g.18538 Transcript_8114/m.18538 type:complete len:107 (-) Transcript_8114:183-503(-)|eukprot:767366-Hanusia_phi.AAC.1
MLAASVRSAVARSSPALKRSFSALPNTQGSWAARWAKPDALPLVALVSFVSAFGTWKLYDLGIRQQGPETGRNVYWMRKNVDISVASQYAAKYPGTENHVHPGVQK